MRTLTLAAVVLALVGAGAVAQDVDEAKPKEASAKVPARKLDFTLKTSDGKTVQLSKVKQDIVVLEWVNQDCPFVKPHYQSGEMQKLAQRSPEKVAWFAVDSTHGRKVESIEEFRKEFKIGHAILVDEDGKVGHMFGAKCTPHVFVLHKGEIVYQGAIDNKQEKDAKEPINYVARALDEILAGKKVSTRETRPYGCPVKYEKPLEKEKKPEPSPNTPE